LLITISIQTNLKPGQIALDKELQTRLPHHDQFVSNRIRHFLHKAYQKNAKVLQAFGLPSWSDLA
jgi:hypothetical protein